MLALLGSSVDVEGFELVMLCCGRILLVGICIGLCHPNLNQSVVTFLPKSKSAIKVRIAVNMNLRVPLILPDIMSIFCPNFSIDARLGANCKSCVRS